MKFRLTIILMLCWVQLFAGWEPFSPEGIHANRIVFYVDNNNHWAVGADRLHLFQPNGQTWSSHFTLIPVKDISYMDGVNILMVLSAGEWCPEDGIHYLYTTTGSIYALEYIPVPHFIKFDNQTSRYYVGYKEGLVYSDNFTDWYNLDLFNDMEIVDMEIIDNHYVVSRMDSNYGVYYSNDTGQTWTLSPTAPMLSDLEFDNNGKLYGVFPDNSWSSGLWSSNDYGATWNVEYWVTGMNCVSTDAMGNVFIGFGEDALPPNVGVARYDSLSHSLHYLNEGLPNLNINQLTYNPGMSAMALFCCTDTGVYINYDYVGSNESISRPVETISVWPNPALEHLYIRHQMKGIINISIYSADGKMIEAFVCSRQQKEFTYLCSDLDPGVYILVIDDGRNRQSVKWIKQ